MDYVHLDFLGRELDERVGQGLDRAVHVALDNHVQFVEVAEGLAAGEFLEGEAHLGAQSLFALELFAFGCDFAGFLFGLEHVECVAGLGSAVEAQDECRGGGTGFLDTLVAFVEHGLDATEVVAGKDDVADAERTVLHEDVGDVAAALVEGRFDDGAGGAAVGVGLQFEQFSLEKHFLHEFLDADAFLGRDVLRLIFAAPVLDKIVHRGELFLDFVGVCVGFVNLVDGENHRYAGSCGMVDGLDGLGHDVVVGGDDDDTEVGDLRTTGTHGGEGFVTGGVEEGDVASVGKGDGVGTDVLCDAAGLACDYVCLADVVEQRCFAVVDVAHDGHNRWTGNEIFRRVFLFVDGVGNLGRYIFGAESELVGHDVDGLGVKALVD